MNAAHSPPSGYARYDLSFTASRMTLAASVRVMPSSCTRRSDSIRTRTVANECVGVLFPLHDLSYALVAQAGELGYVTVRLAARYRVLDRLIQVRACFF